MYFRNFFTSSFVLLLFSLVFFTANCENPSNVKQPGKPKKKGINIVELNSLLELFKEYHVWKEAYNENKPTGPPDSAWYVGTNSTYHYFALTDGEKWKYVSVSKEQFSVKPVVRIKELQRVPALTEMCRMLASFGFKQYPLPFTEVGAYRFVKIDIKIRGGKFLPFYSLMLAEEIDTQEK